MFLFTVVGTLFVGCSSDDDNDGASSNESITGIGFGMKMVVSILKSLDSLLTALAITQNPSSLTMTVMRSLNMISVRAYIA